MGDVTRIERVGGHPAIDFVNTLGGLPERPDDEYVVSYGDLLTWAEGGGLLDRQRAGALHRAAGRHRKRADEALERALQLRDSLDAVLRPRLEGQPSRARDLDVVRDAYAAAVAHADLRWAEEDGAYDWTWPGGRAHDTLDYPLWPLAAHAVELLCGSPLERLSRCGHCRWLFLDTSRNRSRRWCSMNACGAVMKMRRYRAARRP